MIIRRGETTKYDRHYVKEYEIDHESCFNHIFFDPLLNAQIHVHNDTITNQWITYPSLTIENKTTIG